MKTGYYLELLASETMKLHGSTEKKITRYKNNKHVPHLEITEAVRVYCNVVNNDYQQNMGVLYAFVQNKLFGQLSEISPKKIFF